MPPYSQLRDGRAMASADGRGETGSETHEEIVLDVLQPLGQMYQYIYSLEVQLIQGAEMSSRSCPFDLGSGTEILMFLNATNHRLLDMSDMPRHLRLAAAELVSWGGPAGPRAGGAAGRRGGRRRRGGT